MIAHQNEITFVKDIARLNYCYLTIDYEVQSSWQRAEPESRDNPGAPPSIEWWDLTVTCVELYDQDGHYQEITEDGLVFQLAEGLIDSTQVTTDVEEWYEDYEGEVEW